MKNFSDYIKSVRFSLAYALRFAPYETATILFVGVFGGGVAYGSAFLLGKLVDIIISGSRSVDVWYVLTAYAVVNAVPQILANIQSYANRRRGLILQMEVDMELLKKRESIDIATYEDPKFQDLIQRTFRSGLSPLFQVLDSQVNTIRAITSLVVGTILAIHFNPLIYVIVIGTAIPSFFTDIKFASKSWSIWSKDSPEQRRLADLRWHVTQRTLLIETKLLQAGKKFISMVRKIFSDFSEKQLNLEKNRVWQTSLADGVAFLGFAIGLVLVVKGVLKGQIQVGSLIYMISALTAVRRSIGDLLTSVSSQFENVLISQDIIEFFNTKPYIIESSEPKILGLKSAPEIIFENVSFKYHNSKNWSLRNINLTFKAGDNIGLVGNNGAGKTTLVKLLCRIYDPTEGRILINGVDLKDVSIQEWLSYLGIMFQDYGTYDFLVKDAIAIGRPEKQTNLTKVIDSAKIAQAHDFIMEWKDKYEEQLGIDFRGKEPSKGQRQKLSIAKILYRDGFVMILDEPTASVDAESEAKIFDSIENLPKDRTAILISHDFSTISQCDKIFVLDKAILIEEGNHKELMAKKGMYSELYNLQAKRFKK